MVTAVETKEQVGAAAPTLEKLGEKLGIPIKVRPWWGSRRAHNERVHVTCGVQVFDAWNWERRRAEPYCPKCGRFIRIGSAVKIKPVSHVWLCPRIAYPETENGTVIVWAGDCGLEGHNHGQSVEVVDVSESAMVLAVRAGIAGRNFLIAKDNGHPFATALTRTIVTVQDAYDWLVPKFVRNALIQGKDVKRQGDWFFVPTEIDPVKQYRWYGDDKREVPGSDPVLYFGKPYENVHLIYSGVQTRHIGEHVFYRTLVSAIYGAPRVKGEVTAPDHPALNLESWHIGVRRRTAPGTNDRIMRPGFD